ncbi:hypothetical protein E4T56_gene15424, partial [Termitomyces sp. T112]
MPHFPPLPQGQLAQQALRNVMQHRLHLAIGHLTRCGQAHRATAAVFRIVEILNPAARFTARDRPADIQRRHGGHMHQIMPGQRSFPPQRHQLFHPPGVRVDGITDPYLHLTAVHAAQFEQVDEQFGEPVHGRGGEVFRWGRGHAVSAVHGGRKKPDIGEGIMAKTIGIFTRARLVQAVATTALACALNAAPAFAAEAADAPPATGEVGLKEIVVTAQFRSQKLQDTPLSITAVNSDLLKSRNQTDISQIAAQAPNVQLTQMGGAFGSSMAAYIRGVGQYDFNPAYEPGVGIYIDDVYYASLTGSVMDLLDLDRVEVLRGPQGTLTGRNSIGGAIKMFSTKPSAENSG